MRPREFIDALENPDLPRCAAIGEQAELLRTMLVHLFFVDRELDQAELTLLSRVVPDLDMRAYVLRTATRKLDLHRLAALFPEPQDRTDIITLAEHAVWSDNCAKRAEWELVDRVAEALGVVRS